MDKVRKIMIIISMYCASFRMPKKKEFRILIFYNPEFGIWNILDEVWRAYGQHAYNSITYTNEQFSKTCTKFIKTNYATFTKHTFECHFTSRKWSVGFSKYLLNLHTWFFEKHFQWRIIWCWFKVLKKVRIGSLKWIKWSVQLMDKEII